jgi:Spy/CpxP family protein refolding chaperone
VIGFFVAALSVAGLCVMARGRRGDRSWGMRRLFGRLDTSPGQEKVIRNAVLQMRDTALSVRDQARAAQPELAELIRRGNLSQEELNAWMNARLEQMHQASPGLVEAFAKVHEVLDDQQRNQLADFMAKRPGMFGYGYGSRRHGCESC